MRRAVLVGAVSLGLAWSGLRPEAAAAQGFQGTIHFTVRDESGRTVEITQLSKPGKTSFMGAEHGKPGGGMIVDSSAGTMTFVDAEKKSYTVVNLALMRQMASMAKGMQGTSSQGSDGESGPKGTIKPTGRSAVVAGVTCEVYAYDATGNGRRETGEVCLAKGVGLMTGGGGLGDLPGMMGVRRELMQHQLAAAGPVGRMLAQGYGILRATNYEDGRLKGSMVVTALQRGAPPDAAFQPPAGFSEKSMADMMGGRPH